MALRWLSTNDVVLDAMYLLADGSWEPDAVDATWARLGWPTPAGGSVSRSVFELDDCTFWGGGSWIIADSSEGHRIDGFFSPVAWHYDPDDEDDDDLRELVRECVTGDARQAFAGLHDPGVRAVAGDLLPPTSGRRHPEVEWLADVDAGRPDFDAAWRHACAAVSQRLGPPTRVTTDSLDDHEATWRLGPRQLRVEQSDDFDSMSTYDAIYVWLEPYR